MSLNHHDSALFKSYFDSSPSPILLCASLSGPILAANEKACELTACSESELFTRSLLDLVSPEEHEKLTTAWDRSAFKPHASPSFTTLKTRNGGLPIAVEWHRRTVNLEETERSLITLRELTAEARVHEDVRLRTIALESVHCGVTIADARLPGMPLIYVNTGFETITGYTAEESLGISCNFLQGDQRNQPEVDLIRSALKAGKSCDVRLQNHRKDGTLFWNELILSPVKDTEGNLTHYIGIQIDVTDKVSSRLKLEESEERYRALAESVEDIIIMMTTTGEIQFCSPAIERILSEKPDQWVGKPFSALLRDDHQTNFEGILTQLKNRSTKSLRHEFPMRSVKTRETWMDTNLTLVTDPEKGDYIVGVLRDNTLTRKAKDEIATAFKREKELSELKSNFIQIVSHEFRTPMTGIGASNAFLQNYGVGLTAEKSNQHYENIKQSLSRMNRLLDDVLFVSRDESSQLKVLSESLNLSQFTENLIEEIRFIFPKREILVEDALGNAASCASDPYLLRHILHNLLGNALKYSREGTPVTLSLRPNANSEAVVWSIRDEGVGIPACDQKRLFEAFERGNNVSSVQGTGLGLFIARRSADLLGGRIYFTSAENKGSNFHFELPVSFSD